jgi:hypothetical protein
MIYKTNKELKAELKQVKNQRDLIRKELTTIYRDHVYIESVRKTELELISKLQDTLIERTKERDKLRVDLNETMIMRDDATHATQLKHENEILKLQKQHTDVTNIVKIGLEQKLSSVEKDKDALHKTVQDLQLFNRKLAADLDLVQTKVAQLDLITKDREKFRNFVWNLFQQINSLNGQQLSNNWTVHHIGLLLNATESWLTEEGAK